MTSNKMFEDIKICPNLLNDIYYWVSVKKTNTIWKSFLLIFISIESQKSEVTFFGSEYIFYDFMAQGTDPISSHSDRVEFYFRTKQHTSFLFYTGKGLPLVYIPVGKGLPLLYR